MFPLLRASPSLSIGQRDQATDGWMRTIAQPRDAASVFFHCSPRWSSPSSRPEHDLENLQAFDETMRPRRYLERNRDCVRTDFAPGRPPPVHPRLTGACAAMRGFQICVSGHAQMQRPPSAWPALRPSSRCQTARCAAWFRAARLFPATHLCARVGLYPFAPDPKRGGRSADRRTMSVVAFARRDGPRE